MSCPRFRAYPVKGPRTQAGAALLAFLLVLLVGGSYALLGDAKSLAQRAKLEESRKTSEALAEAKAALIGYAVSREIDPNCTASGNNCPRPGDLPCPDVNNDGVIPATGIGSSCGNASGSTGQASRLARLPWRTLNLGDVRDGAGERLWYAVSATFKANRRSICTNAGSFGCLNSDVRGRITVKVPRPDTDGDGDPDGFDVVHDGRNPDWRNPAERVDPAAQWTPRGAVAVLIAPGKPLKRQNRGGACETESTASCARNYLDVGLGEDNATFYDGPTLSNRGDGFIAGEVLENCDEGACDVIVNDRFLPITYQDIIPLLEKRVVGEVLACLRRYADPTTGSNGRYPWAANVADVSDGSYSDVIDNSFGRLPDPQFGNIQTGMQSEWLSGCPLLRTDVTPHSHARWWLNWKELVFYGVADGHKPQASPPPANLCATTPNSCLIVNPEPSRKEVVVIAAGKRLEDVPDPAAPPPPPTLDQIRTTTAQKGDPPNYLEGDNATNDNPTPPPDDYKSFILGNLIPTFNDVVGYLPRP